MTFPENIIHSSADCSVKKFKDCAFAGKYKTLLISGEATEEELKAAFEYIYAEYVDYAELYQSREFEMSAYINWLGNRIGVITRFIELQRRFMKEFESPFIPAFGLVKKYGHHLWWDFAHPDKDAFLKKLMQIEMKEKKYEHELNKKVTELLDLQKKKIKKEHTLLESRKDFITMCNRLQQARFVIDQDKTMVEELALAIKDQRDQQQSDAMNAKTKR